MTISTTKNTWESICDLFSSIEIKESSIEIKESSIEKKRSFSIHLETVVGGFIRVVGRGDAAAFSIVMSHAHVLVSSGTHTPLARIGA